jgi:putative ABC transport system permease protein
VGESAVRITYQVQTAFRLATDTIRSHKLRSFLTLLGVVIGVASVVIVGAAIEGLGAYAEQSTSKAFGTNSFLVAQFAMTGNMSRRDFREKMKRNKPIRADDARFVQAIAGDQVYFSPSRQRGSSVLKYMDLVCEDTTITGVASAMQEIRDIGVAQGRFFTDQEERAGVHVAVIGEDVQTALFPGSSSPLGRVLRIDGAEFTVIGVLEKLGSAFGRSQDNAAYIPVTAFNRMYGPGTGLQLYGRARPASGLSLDQALDETRVALRTRLHTPVGKPDNFDSQTPEATRVFIDSILGIISAAVIPITSISLVVGGVVIMNIMLVSVTERTREIGIRKALGARQSDIMLQVLIEAVALSVAGGVLGLALAALVTGMASRILGVPLVITPGYVVLAIGVSSAVGVLSGWYPAKRAAKLDPVVALRAE